MKGFRHLFATVVANGGLAEHERRYLMGHAPGRDAIHVYTHLNELADHYRAVAESRWFGVLEVIRARIASRPLPAPASGYERKASTSLLSGPSIITLAKGSVPLYRRTRRPRVPRACSVA